MTKREKDSENSTEDPPDGNPPGNDVEAELNIEIALQYELQMGFPIVIMTSTGPIIIYTGANNNFILFQDRNSKDDKKDSDSDSNSANRKKTGGESAHTRRGRDAHKKYNPGRSFDKEPRIQYGDKKTNGRKRYIKPDGVDFRNRIVKELKPNTASGIRRGMHQLQFYKNILEKVMGGVWKKILETYDP